MFAPRFRSFARPATSQCLRLRIPMTPRHTILSRTQQQRHQSTVSGFKKLFKAQPYMMTLACSLLVISSYFFVIETNRYYFNHILVVESKYPAAVAKYMKRALWYSDQELDPKKAVKYYREAIRAADEIGMDPFSDEIIGIKIRLAQFLEKIQRYQSAITVLEIVKSDNLKWIEVLGGKEGNEGKRTRVLQKTVGVSVKLGELYANDYVKEEGKAEESLVWAVETVLKEKLRREKDGMKEGEGEWMSPEEIGGTMESLGHHYEEKNMHHLAAPLFLQALAVSPPNSCHTVVLMNNLSISLAQQDPPPTPGQPPASRSQLVDNAKLWAQKAIAIAANIAPPERTEECDEGCVVATHNLGEFAEMDGDIREARKRYDEAKSLAKAIGFQDGLINSEDGLRRLAEK